MAGLVHRVGRILGLIGIAPIQLQVQAAAAQDSTFLLTSEDPARKPSPFLGNGHFSLVIPPLGIGASSSMLAGLSEHGPSDVPRITELPAWNDLTLSRDDQSLSASSTLADYRQTIDMARGSALTSYTWIQGDTPIAVQVEQFVSRADPALAAIRVTLQAQSATRIGLRIALAARPPPRRLALATLTRTDPSWGPVELWYPGHMLRRAGGALIEGGGARAWIVANPVGRSTSVAVAAALSWSEAFKARAASAGDTSIVELSLQAIPGQPYSVTEIVSVVPASRRGDPLAQATRSASAGRTRGFEALAADNGAAWERRWESDIIVQGDPDLQRVVRSMLFYLLCSADSGTGFGVPPMGLSSAGYYGHVFWDSDTWMFPGFLLLHPDVARSMVDFRAGTLPAALANARSNGFRGAMYPWEADELGRETTPQFAAQNASSEIHVTGDVAVAQWQYYQASGDSAWLARRGFPVIRETANFWLSRVAMDRGRRYHIHDVVSVAEGLIGVIDDAYTNAVARRTLEIAGLAAKRLGQRVDPRWTEVATRLHLPLDSATGSYRTYEGAPDSTLGVITPLLSYPLGLPMSDQAKRTHLDQAVRRLQDEAAGAMMGITLLSVDAAELGDSELVDSLLPYSYRGHLRGPFLLLSETPANNAISFLTGAGGFLQQVIFGYTGLRLEECRLTPRFPAVLPRRISRLILRNIQVCGERFDITVDAEGRRIEPHHAGVPP